MWASSPQGVSIAGWGAAPLRVPVRPQLLSAARKGTWMCSRLVFEDKWASLRQVENGRYLLMTGTWICGLKAQTFILSSRRKIARPPHTPQALREDGKHIAPSQMLVGFTQLNFTHKIKNITVSSRLRGVTAFCTWNKRTQPYGSRADPITHTEELARPGTPKTRGTSRLERTQASGSI